VPEQWPSALLLNAMTPHRTLYLAAYDIRDDSRRTEALRLLRAFATGGQKSVHEVWLTSCEKRDVLDDMVFILRASDRFLLLRLDTRSKPQVLGRAQPVANPDHFYIG